jgi:rhodanese-related sulfurtransferase
MNTTRITAQHAEPKTAAEYSLSEFYLAWRRLLPDEIIVDIRSPADYAEAHIPGSRNIPYANVMEQHHGLRRYSRVYLYCYGGKGSKDIASRLADMDITETCYLGNAGMADWQNAGHLTNRN